MAASTSNPSSAARRAGSVAHRSVDRGIERRRATYEDEVARLIDSSFEIIRETGNLEPTVGQIVARAGLSNQAFYKHFRSKDELLLGVLDEGIHRLQAYIEQRTRKARTPTSKIRGWIEGILEQALNQESAQASRPFALSRARLAEQFPKEVAESGAELTRLLRDAIAEAVESGDLPDADPDRDAELIYHLAIGWLERKLPDPNAARRAEADHLVQFAMHGLKKGNAS